MHGLGLVSELRNGTNKFYHADALGTTRAMTGSTGSVTDTKSTDAFGNTFTPGSSGTTPTPFGFAGQHGYQSDPDSGLMRLGHRYYDSSVGRFLSRDPIQDGYNWYTYCDNDPVNGVDPEGLQARDENQDPPLWRRVLDGIGAFFYGAGQLGMYDSPHEMGALPLRRPARPEPQQGPGPPLSKYKEALEKVHKEVGHLPKGEPGKFGSPTRGDTKKGYRLDPGHPDAPGRNPDELGPHYNWWDYTKGIKGPRARGVVPIK